MLLLLVLVLCAQAQEEDVPGSLLGEFEQPNVGDGEVANNKAQCQTKEECIALVRSKLDGGPAPRFDANNDAALSGGVCMKRLELGTTDRAACARVLFPLYMRHLLSLSSTTRKPVALADALGEYRRQSLRLLESLEKFTREAGAVIEPHVHEEELKILKNDTMFSIAKRAMKLFWERPTKRSFLLGFRVDRLTLTHGRMDVSSTIETVGVAYGEDSAHLALKAGGQDDLVGLLLKGVPEKWRDLVLNPFLLQSKVNSLGRNLDGGLDSVLKELRDCPDQKCFDGAAERAYLVAYRTKIVAQTKLRFAQTFCATSACHHLLERWGDIFDARLMDWWLSNAVVVRTLRRGLNSLNSLVCGDNTVCQDAAASERKQLEMWGSAFFDDKKEVAPLTLWATQHLVVKNSMQTKFSPFPDGVRFSPLAFGVMAVAAKGLQPYRTRLGGLAGESNVSAVKKVLESRLKITADPAGPLTAKMLNKEYEQVEAKWLHAYYAWDRKGLEDRKKDANDVLKKFIMFGLDDSLRRLVEVDTKLQRCWWNCLEQTRYKFGLEAAVTHIAFLQLLDMIPYAVACETEGCANIFNRQILNDVDLFSSHFPRMVELLDSPIYNVPDPWVSVVGMVLCAIFVVLCVAVGVYAVIARVYLVNKYTFAVIAGLFLAAALSLSFYVLNFVGLGSFIYGRWLFALVPDYAVYPLYAAMLLLFLFQYGMATFGDLFSTERVPRLRIGSTVILVVLLLGLTAGAVAGIVITVKTYQPIEEARLVYACFILLVALVLLVYSSFIHHRVSRRKEGSLRGVSFMTLVMVIAVCVITCASAVQVCFEILSMDSQPLIAPLYVSFIIGKLAPQLLITLALLVVIALGIFTGRKQVAKKNDVSEHLLGEMAVPKAYDF